MTSPHGRRMPLATLFGLALAALALVALPAAAAARDRNHDHIPDRWEKKHHLSLRVNQARRDQDGDHLNNRAEFLAGFNPRSADSNGNGIPDNEEGAGTIASFESESGKLTINLFGGETLSGLVTESTEIKCEGSSGASASDVEESGDDEGSDGGEEAGEAQGGEEEAGDGEGSSGETPGEDDGQDEEGAAEEGGQQAEGDGGSSSCTTTDLVPGAVVHSADLKLENGAATFEEIELSGHEA